MWKTILTIILIFAVLSAVLVILRQKKAAREARFRAAAILLRERQLKKAIQRDADHDQGRNRFILEISWKDGRKRSYVFDPSGPVRIGRDPEHNQICIRRDDVSAEHCLLVMYKGALTVQDLNSTNGTFIKRGRRRYRVNGRVYLKNGDRLEVGGLSMKVCLFFFDAAFI